MKKEIKEILKETIDISSFIELDKLIEKDFDCISTYQKIGSSTHKIREKKYLNGKLVFEKSYERMDDDYLFLEEKKHDFDYSEQSVVREIIKEENDSNEDYTSRRFDKNGRLIFEQNSSNYDQPGYEKIFFYKDETDELLKIELWYNERIKYFELNFGWDRQNLKSIERIHFKNENRFSKEYFFFNYNELGQLKNVLLELQGLTGKIEFKYDKEQLIEKYKEYNFFGIKVGKAIEHNFYSPINGLRKIITAEYFDNKFIKGEKYFLREEIIRTQIKEENGSKEKIIIVEIEAKSELIKDENDMEEYIKRQ